MAAKKQPGTNSTSTVYVGIPRFQAAQKRAIDISFHSGVQITASQFIHYLMDNYSEVARDRYLEELKR